MKGDIREASCWFYKTEAFAPVKLPSYKRSFSLFYQNNAFWLESILYGYE